MKKQQKKACIFENKKQRQQKETQILVDIYFDFCKVSYCSMARKFYETLLEVFKSLIWSVSIPW